MKISSLVLKNYRSYIDARFLFHEKINVIIGDGLSGKSNIVRALKYISTQRPISPNHHNQKALKKPLKIRLKTDNGTIIGFEKKSNGNANYFISDGNNVETFRKFGKNVPEEVSKAINLHPINFQEQLNAPFILSDSPVETTRIINKITKVEIVNEWITRCNNRISFYRNAKKTERDNLKVINKRLSQLSFVDNLDSIVKRLLRTDKKIKDEENQYYEIHALVGEIQQHSIIKEKCEKGLEAERVINRLREIEKQIDELKEKELFIISLNKSIKRHKGIKDDLKKIIDEYSDIMKSEKFCPFCFNKIDLKEIKKRLK